MVYSRKNQRDLTRTERRRFVDAVLTIKRSGRYDDFVAMHREFYVTDGEDRPRAAHMTPSFFPWHRQYLLEFEQALRETDPAVSVPYWDWTLDRSPGGPPWTPDFLGGNGREGDRQVTTGPFAHREGNWSLSNGVTDGLFLTRDFGRPADPVALPTAGDVQKALDDPLYDAEPWNSLSRTGFRNRVEGWGVRGARAISNHNQVHRWVGGAMAGAGSPNDPVFWLHHAFIDRLWDRWQRAHPGSGYLPARGLAGDDPQHGRVFARNEPLPPWEIAPSRLLDHSRVYRYA